MVQGVLVVAAQGRLVRVLMAHQGMEGTVEMERLPLSLVLQ
jgi:hypothetical protein